MFLRVVIDVCFKVIDFSLFLIMYINVSIYFHVRGSLFLLSHLSENVTMRAW